MMSIRRASAAALVILVGGAGASAQPAVNQDALDRLVERARESESDALVVVRDGVTIGTWRFGKPEGPIESMSATKSIVALAFGVLLADGRLESLDEPVCTFFPEWKQGRKADVTIRHLLGQRSGLQNVPRTTVEIYPSPDFVQLALCAELTEDPGSTWRYNNKACNLLAGVVERIAGEPMDDLLGRTVFAPLGITDWSWTRDRAGNPHGMSGLQIRPEDLAKLGRLMLDEGEWNGARILPRAFVRDLITDQAHPMQPEQAGTVMEYWGPSYGLGWWVVGDAVPSVTERLLDAWRESAMPEDFIEALTPLLGARGPEIYAQAVELAGGEERWAAMTWQADRPDFDILPSPPVGYAAKGYLGQLLVVLPESRLVAVRMRRSPEGEFDERAIDSMRDFERLVRALVEEQDAP